MLDKLTVEDFAPHVGTEFLCRLQDGSAYALKLVEATPYSTQGGRATAPNRRQPFSLIFLGPPEPILPQAIYPLEHAGMETLPIFIVPIGREPEGIEYQAVFN